MLVDIRVGKTHLFFLKWCWIPNDSQGDVASHLQRCRLCLARHFREFPSRTKQHFVQGYNIEVHSTGTFENNEPTSSSIPPFLASASSILSRSGSWPKGKQLSRHSDFLFLFRNKSSYGCVFVLIGSKGISLKSWWFWYLCCVFPQKWMELEYDLPFLLGRFFRLLSGAFACCSFQWMYPPWN